MRKLALVLGLCVAGIAGCGKESPPPPPAPKAQAPAPTPAPTPSPAPSPAPPEAASAAAPIAVGVITLGKAIGPDKKVTAATETFNKSDTIYVVVDTTGTGDAKLMARWTYLKGDKPTLVDESAQTVIATGPTTSEFHISKPDGWPPGEYQVEILVNDKPAGTKKFTVI